MLLMDVDGVLTDGGIYYGNDGEELKRFHVHDGYGVMKLKRSGFLVGIITGRVSRIVQRRAGELGYDDVHQNLDDKMSAYEAILRRHGLEDREVAYIGDDEPDIPVLKRVGFSAAPANALPSVRRVVHYVCRRRGGDGAVREVIDMILRSQTRPRGT